MALLIYGLDTDEIGTGQSWRDTLAELLPDLEVRIFPDAGDTSEITYLAFMRPDFDVIPQLPNLRAMFSRSAGVESFIIDPARAVLESDWWLPISWRWNIGTCGA